MFKTVQRLVFGPPTIASITSTLKKVFANLDDHQRELDAEADRLHNVVSNALIQREELRVCAQQARKLAVNLCALLATACPE